MRQYNTSHHSDFWKVQVTVSKRAKLSVLKTAARLVTKTAQTQFHAGRPKTLEHYNRNRKKTRRTTGSGQILLAGINRLIAG